MHSDLPTAKTLSYCWLHIQWIIIMTHNYPTALWPVSSKAAQELRRRMCSRAHVHTASACVYICMYVCRAAAVFVLCNLEQPVRSRSIPHKQSQAALYVRDANQASAPKIGQGPASNSCQSACQCLVTSCILGLVRFRILLCRQWNILWRINVFTWTHHSCFPSSDDQQQKRTRMTKKCVVLCFTLSLFLFCFSLKISIILSSQWSFNRKSTCHLQKPDSGTGHSIKISKLYTVLFSSVWERSEPDPNP